MKKVGFIGLGIMGRAMAINAAKAGFEVYVTNRNAEKAEALRAYGIAPLPSPRAIADACEAVVVMVTGPEALAAVTTGEQGLATASLEGTLVINSSTVSVDSTLQTAKAVTRAGGHFLDAPVSGSRIPAETAQLVFLIGGDAEQLQVATPLLGSMGKANVVCGEIGNGTRMKLAVNLLLANMLGALSETLVFSQKMGLDPQHLMEAVGNSVLNAPILKMKGDAMLQRDFHPHFPLDLAFKDINLILQEAGELGSAMPQTAALREVFSSAMAHDYGRDDLASILKIIESMSGLEPQ
uniref:Putative 3-hydroxyisobutyrate dehydrogenase family protein n=1 Tax=Magnetococcus massalia (strain MO-1) TaxID=451514 RepID=A0A1S7LIS1_MAGMO|nr:Putative 3-hydroxyisobutyrate dehydrogenase family protein [Candidatus Magnetococcus massalia]